MTNTSEIFDTKDPQYTTTIQLDPIWVEFEKNKGASVFSKAFNFGRRSWVLKIDIDYDKNISIFLVEKGEPIIPQSP